MTRITRVLIPLAATVMVVAFGTAWAEEPNQDELTQAVEQLQKQVAELQADARPADASQKTWMDKAFEKIDIHGYVAQGYTYSSDHQYLYMNSSDGDFQFNEMALNVYTELSSKMSVAIQLYARDLGIVGNDAIQLDYAFGDYRFTDALGVRAGRIRIPWGLYGDTRDVDMARTSIFMPQCIYAETQRDVAYGMIGFGAYGTLGLGGGGSLEYQAQVGSNNLDDRNTAVGWATFGSTWTEPDWRSNHGTITTGRLIWNTPLDGLRLGGSYFTLDKVTFTGKSANDPFLVDVNGIPAGTDWTWELSDVVWWTGFAEYSIGDLILAGEYVSFENTAEDSLWVATGIGGKSTTKGDGWYVSGRYRVNDWFELGSYYSNYWPNKHDRKGTGYVAYGWPTYYGWSKDLALSLRFDIAKGFVFKLEGHHMDGTANLASSINDIASSKKNAYLFAAKASFTF